eukprot:comp23233_c0_seq1/m.37904 comp23233_c0_seq1/g.37904  ORF comp23233_c0_seq1/g.37904 comp23233_c0_seq1/m.37904 type:complete len:434 (-) comp23233_c0_seq1:601-1902(-)
MAVAGSNTRPLVVGKARVPSDMAANSPRSLSTSTTNSIIADGADHTSVKVSGGIPHEKNTRFWRRLSVTSFGSYSSMTSRVSAPAGNDSPRTPTTPGADFRVSADVPYTPTHSKKERFSRRSSLGSFSSRLSASTTNTNTAHLADMHDGHGAGMDDGHIDRKGSFISDTLRRSRSALRLGTHSKRTIEQLNEELTYNHETLAMLEVEMAQMMDQLKETTATVQQTEAELWESEETVHDLQEDNRKLAKDTQRLGEEVSTLLARLEQATTQAELERRSADTVYNWYMGSMLEQEALRTRLDQQKQRAAAAAAVTASVNTVPASASSFPCLRLPPPPVTVPTPAPAAAAIPAPAASVRPEQIEPRELPKTVEPAGPSTQTASAQPQKRNSLPTVTEKTEKATVPPKRAASVAQKSTTQIANAWGVVLKKTGAALR